MYFPLEMVQNFVLCHGISMVDTCYQLSSRKKQDAPRVINWTVVVQLS